MVAIEANEWSFVGFRFRFRGDLLWGFSRKYKVTAFCRKWFLVTVAQVPFKGWTGLVGIVGFQASGARWRGFAGRGARTNGVVARPEAMYCAMTARRYTLMESMYRLFDPLVKGRKVDSTREMAAEQSARFIAVSAASCSSASRID